MVELLLWVTGFALLAGIAFYAASHNRKDQNAANRVLEKRNLKTQSAGQQDVRGVEDVEHLNPKENQDG